MSSYSFKSLGDNKYEMFYKKDSLGITFITPDGYSIEDYELYFTEEDFKPCKDVVIKLQNPPKTFKSINIASNADITFNDGLSFCVGNSVTLAKNKNLLFCAKDGVKEVVVDNLMVKKNKYTSLVCNKIQMNNSSSSNSLIKFIASNSSEAEAKTKIPIYLENIKLDSHACLEVNLSGDLSKEVSLPVEFKNTDFNQYNAFEIGGALSVENSFFKGLRLISNHDDKEITQKIDNSIFKSIVRLHNISKVSFSEINNTDISNNKEVEVSNEFIKDQRIGNYEDFAKNSQTRANFDRDSRITEDLEVL